MLVLLWCVCTYVSTRGVLMIVRTTTAHLNSYVHTYVCTYHVHTLHTCLCTNIQTYVCTYVRTCIHTHPSCRKRSCWMPAMADWQRSRLWVVLRFRCFLQCIPVHSWVTKCNDFVRMYVCTHIRTYVIAYTYMSYIHTYVWQCVFVNWCTYMYIYNDALLRATVHLLLTGAMRVTRV